MSKEIEERVVEMRFDNQQFEAHAKESISTLEKLEKSLNLSGASKGLEEVEDAAKRCDLTPLSSSVESVKSSFSALEVMAVTALVNITNSAVNAGKSLVSSLTIDQVSAGWDKYADKTSAVQTIMAATAKDFSDTKVQMAYVNEQLDKLNWFTDETSYNFLEMVSSIGKFTSNNISLDKSVTAMQGIATWAAISGANTQEASRAMYNLSQAIAVGSVKLIDWKSIENANMATASFKETAIETAVALGTLKKKSDGLFETLKGHEVSVSNFNENLSDAWFTSEVLLETLDKYGGYANNLYELYSSLGSEVNKTTSQIISDMKELQGADDETILSYGYTKDQIELVRQLSAEVGGLGQRAFAAAQEAKTFGEAIDSVKDAVSTGWMTTFEIIFGDYEEAKVLWTDLANTLYDVFASSAETRNAMLSDWKTLGGRTVLLEAVSNAFRDICAVAKPVKEAFRDIFPAMTAERLYAITVGLRNFLATLEISEDTANKLQRTFGGLFALLDIIGTVAGGVIYNVFNALGTVIGGLDLDILGFTANVGDAIVMVRDWIDEHNLLTKGVEALVNGLKTVIPIIQKWVKQFMSLPQVQANVARFQKAFQDTFSNIHTYLDGGKEQIRAFLERVKALDSFSLENVKAVLKDFRENVLGYFLNLDGIFDSLGAAVSAFRADIDESLDGAKDKAKNTFDQIVQFMVNFKDNLFNIASEIRSKLADKIGFGEIFAIGIGTALVVFVKKISDALSTLAAPFEGIGALLGSVSKALKAFATQMKAKALLTAAEAILMLVGALAVLTLLDQEKLKGAVIVLGLLAAGLVALSFAISKMGDTKSLVNLSTSLLSVGASLLLLSTAMKQLEGIGAGDALGSITILTALAAGLVVVAKLLGSSKKTFYSGSLFLLSFSLSLKILVGVFDDIASMDISGASKTVGLLLGAMASLALVATACKNVKFGAAATILAIVVSLKILIGCFDQVAKLDMGKANSNLGAFLTIFSTFALLMVASKFAGENASKAGSAIMKMSAGLLLIVTAFKMMEGIDPLTLERSTNVISQLLLVFGAVTALSHFAGKNAAKAGTMILAMSGAILILSTAMVVLAHLDGDGLQQALGAVVVLESVFAVLVGITYFAKYASDVTKTLTVLTVALAVMVASVAGLSLMDQDRLVGATTALSLLMATFSLVVASTHLAKKAQGVLVVLTLVVAALAGILTAMSLFDTQSAIQNASAIAILLTSLSASLLILSKAGTIAPTAYGAIAVMLLIAAGIGAIMGIMSAFNVEASIESAGAISVLLLAMSGACLILSAVGSTGPAAFVGIGALAVLIAAIGGIMAAICALTADNPTIEEDLDRAVMVMEKIGTGLGAALGGFVGGALGGLTSGLPIIGENLSGFMENAQPFFDAVKGIDADAMNGVKSLAETLLLLTGANVADGLTSWFTGGTSLADFGAELIPFGENFALYAKAVEGINPEVVTASANAAKTLAEFANAIPNSGGLLADLVGDNSLSAFAADLVPFGESFAQYAAAIEGVNPEIVTASANAAYSLAEFANAIPNQGGVLADLVGDNTLSSFAEELAAFGPSLKSYADSVAGLDAGVVENSANAATALAEMAGKLPNSGGALAWWVGDNTLSSFAEELKAFGPSLKSYADSVTGLNTNVVDASVAAASALSALANGLPNSGGALAWWVGDNDLSTFGAQLVLFGDNLSAYAVAVKNVKPDVVTASANAAGALSQLATNLPSASVFDQWFGGEQTLASFGEDIASFGDSMGAYYSKVSTVDSTRLSSVITNVWGLVNLAEGTKGLDTSGFTTFTTALTNMGDAGLTGFISAFNDSESEVTSAVGTMLGYVSSAIIHETPSFTTTLTAEANGVVSQVVSALNAKRTEFVTCGTYLVSGLAQGMRSNTGAVTLAATNMANASVTATRKTLQIASPSKVFQAIGGFLVGGFATGIKNNMPDAVDTSALLGTSVTESISSIFNTSASDLGSSFASSIASGISSSTSAEDAAKEKAQAIVDAFKEELDKIDLDMTTKDLELSLWKATIGQSSTEDEISYAELDTIEEKIVLQQEAVNVAYREFEATVKEFGEASEEAQEAYNKYLQEQIDLAELQNDIAEQNQAILDRSYQFSMDWIEEQKYYGKMTLAEELAAYKRVQSRYEKGTEERKKLDREVYTLEKEIYEAQKQYIQDVQDLQESANAQRVALEEEYADTVKQINDQLEADIESLTEAYENEVKNRAKTLYDSYGLFDEVAEREEVSGETLLKNLQDQVTEFEDWQDTLGNLSARGIDEELIEELQEMGPSAIAQIKALEAMSDDELDKYVGLWGVKHALAKEQATSELEDLRIETYKQIAQLRVDADEQLSEYQADWQSRMNKLNETTSRQLQELREEFAKKVGLIKEDTEAEMAEMAETAQEILTSAGWDATGKAIVDGITGGVISNEDAFLNALTEMALAGVEAVNETLGINSPSRVFWESGNYAGMGFVNGLSEYATQSYTAGSEMGENAVDGLATAISQIGNAVYSEEDGEFVIRPVLDLSDIQNGVGAIGGMFASAGDLRLAGRVSASMARYGKSGTTTVTVKSDDVVKELRQLREDMSELGDRVGKLQVVLDSGTLVGEIAQPMDHALGHRATLKGRRV